MNKSIFVLIGLIIILLFTILTGSLRYSTCGVLFGPQCQKFTTAQGITGLVVTAMILFFAATIFAIIFIAKKLKWAQYAEVAALGFGAILMLAAVALIMSDDLSMAYSPIMCAIGMTLSLELTVVVMIRLFTGKNF